MRFTEAEMTAAVEAVARQLYAATRPPWRRGGVDAAWREMKPMDKYRRKAAAGEMVLPALVELPERPTVGARPEFTAAEYEEAATTGTRDLLERRSPGSWASMPERRRRRLVRTTALLTRVGVRAMPVRQDPDALVVPDTPAG